MMDKELLNEVYRELCDAIGEDNMLSVYKLLKGQQITFPMRLYDSKKVREVIKSEYNGHNLSALACKYDYSERSIRRMVKNKLNRKSFV